MAKINVVNLGGEKVGEFELLDEVFSAEINDALLWEAVKHYRAALRQGTAATKTARRFRVRARSCGSRRARAARVSVRSARRSGVAAVRSTDRSRAATSTQFPRKKLMGALRSAICGEDRGRQVHGRRYRSSSPRARPSCIAHGAEQARSGQDDAAGGVEPQAGREALPRQPQSAGRGAGAFVARFIPTICCATSMPSSRRMRSKRCRRR